LINISVLQPLKQENWNSEIPLFFRLCQEIQRRIVRSYSIFDGTLRSSLFMHHMTDILRHGLKPAMAMHAYCCGMSIGTNASAFAGYSTPTMPRFTI
jgi:hypothetical protein